MLKSHWVLSSCALCRTTFLKLDTIRPPSFWMPPYAATDSALARSRVCSCR